MAQPPPPPPPPPPPRPPAPPGASGRGAPVESARVMKAVDQGWWSTIDAADHLVGRHPARWGVTDAVIGLVLAQLSALLGVVIIIVATGRADSGAGVLEDFSVGTLVVLQAFLWVGYGGWTMLVTSRRGNGPVLDYGWRFKGADVYQGLLLGAGLQMVAVPAIYLFLFLFIGEQDVSEAARGITELVATPLDVVLLVLVIVVGAPIIEELFFRGLLLRSLERRWGSKVALGVSSLVFALVHFQILQFPALLMFGLMAGWLTIRSGRLGPAIWAHVGFNAVTVVALLVTSAG